MCLGKAGAIFCRMRARPNCPFRQRRPFILVVIFQIARAGPAPAHGVMLGIRHVLEGYVGQALSVRVLSLVGDVRPVQHPDNRSLVDDD